MSQLSQKSQIKLQKGQIVGLLQDYRELNKQIHETSEEIIMSQNPKMLTNYLDKNDSYFQDVRTPSTFAKDCETLRTITETAVTQSSNVNLGPRPFTFNNVRQKMMAMFPDGRYLDWDAIGEWALRRSLTAPICTPFLFGLEEFEVKKRERAPTQRKGKDVIEEEQEVKNKDMSQAIANQLLARARKLCDRLKKDGDMPVSKVIATKAGFSESVENAFELSHLVRDGKVGLHTENSKVVATANVQQSQANDRRKQCILHLRDIDYQKLLQLEQ
ncbi:hypothetical protein TVAG_281340 [Trichomonas vaginalis G3]|uniref:Non-structural maintenance of chromosomes element 4 n=1 Tax=Trichomonas vaginalis (strain ATCC PRA-98 / G3) TaxID=412133 RepID=A2F958_TRIV3|nr:non-structural maintenance of chromosomes element 4 family [Trichomonas vaginalis G3]EAX98536.1 hypothetical protein TVAG_281340 [Trichomonas vaginalis G3]KAI5553033.1 non-structural maintenance of chromosomes element 4 family [Trichomonas vaginalis G3]|eukprot:XP_001311466.1 hypothetical protein [Trichomonas vaginalis G3]